MIVTEVPADTAFVIRPKIEDTIKRGCDASLGTHTPDSLFSRIKDGTCFLLIAGENKEVTALGAISIMSYPGGLNAILIELLEGSSDGRSAIREYVERAALRAGANAVLYYANKRQEKRLKDGGYRAAKSLMMKELPHAIPA